MSLLGEGVSWEFTDNVPLSSVSGFKTNHQRKLDVMPSAIQCKVFDFRSSLEGEDGPIIPWDRVGTLRGLDTLNSGPTNSLEILVL